MSMLFSAADAVSSCNWSSRFKVQTLNVTMSSVFLHLSNFVLDMCLSSVADFSNIRSRAPTSAERASCFLARRTVRLGHTVLVYDDNTLSLTVFLINGRLPYGWIPLVSDRTIWLGRWLLKFFHPASGEACRWPIFGFICLPSDSPCCFRWLKVRWVGDYSRGWPEGSLFNRYYIEV